ncbi:MAG: flavodoxin domain-containing protein [Eubacterium sp.]
MIRTVVTYQSKYGSTEKYAKWIAESLNCASIPIKQVKKEDFEKVDVFIFGGGLYATGIEGLKEFKTKAAAFPEKKWVIFTMGLSDPQKTDYSEVIDHNFTPEEKQNTTFFHLRGGIDYKKLSFVHRGMMAMMHKMINKNPSPDHQAFNDSYGKAVDFSDLQSIQPLLDYIQNIETPQE